MPGPANLGESTTDGWVFQTSTYPGEMERMRKACAILLNACSEINVMPLKESIKKIIEVPSNILKDLDG